MTNAIASEEITHATMTIRRPDVTIIIKVSEVMMITGIPDVTMITGVRNATMITGVPDAKITEIRDTTMIIGVDAKITKIISTMTITEILKIMRAITRGTRSRIHLRKR
jgi:hypothetical protein